VFNTISLRWKENSKARENTNVIKLI